MVKVDAVPNGMHDGEEQCSEGNDLVEGDSGIKWDILVNWCLPKVGDEVTSHCQQQYRIGKHHTRSSSTSNCDTITSNTTQTSMFSLYRII